MPAENSLQPAANRTQPTPVSSHTITEAGARCSSDPKRSRSWFRFDALHEAKPLAPSSIVRPNRNNILILPQVIFNWERRVKSARAVRRRLRRDTASSASKWGFQKIGKTTLHQERFAIDVMRKVRPFHPFRRSLAATNLAEAEWCVDSATRSKPHATIGTRLRVVFRRFGNRLSWPVHPFPDTLWKRLAGFGRRSDCRPSNRLTRRTARHARAYAEKGQHPAVEDKPGRYKRKEQRKAFAVHFKLPSE